ncbi:MAG: aldo/keto reductase [Puniceicoccales bacterium]|nr:aldo/keto reductase [Puniceicoccales bacterium]
MAIPEIPFITLNDGRRIPQLGLGMWQMPGDKVAGAVEAALDAGYRAIDTAAAYFNEGELGAALKNTAVPREQLYITTKLWNSEQGFDETLRAFDKSLGLLGLEYVDLYLIHWPLPMFDKYSDTWKALVRLRDEGRAKSIGVSNFNPDHLERIIGESGVTPAVNQIELHPYFAQRAVREFHAQRGIAIESWSPLAQGRGLFEDATVAAIAQKHGRTPAQIAIRWHIQQGLIVIPKSVTPSRIRENFAVTDFSLDADDVAALDKLDSGRRLGPDPKLLDLLHI